MHVILSVLFTSESRNTRARFQHNAVSQGPTFAQIHTEMEQSNL